MNGMTSIKTEQPPGRKATPQSSPVSVGKSKEYLPAEDIWWKIA